MILGENAPEPVKAAEAEQAVAKAERDLHLNLRTAFDKVERDIARLVQEQRGDWRPQVVKQRDEARKRAHKALTLLSEQLAEIVDLSAAMLWADEPLSNAGTLKDIHPQQPTLRIGGDSVALDAVFDRLARVLDDRPQPRPGVTFAPKPQDGSPAQHVPPQFQKPRHIVSTVQEAKAMQDAARKANSVATV